MTPRRAILAGLIAALAPLADAAAGTWEAGAFRFSDELGGFEILSVTGTGVESDPVVVTERFTSPEPAILTIHLGPDAASDFVRLSIVIIVINQSRRSWVGFDLELQEELHRPSVYVDGLSFDQMHVFANRVFRSDRFSVFSDLSEPYDRVRFDGGHVDHGERVQMRFFITDVTPKRQFYLLQEPQFLSAARPRPPGFGICEIRPGIFTRHCTVIPASSPWAAGLGARSRLGAAALTCCSASGKHGERARPSPGGWTTSTRRVVQGRRCRETKDEAGLRPVEPDNQVERRQTSIHVAGVSF